MAVFVSDLSVPDATGRLLRTTAGQTHDALARAHGLCWLIAVVAIPFALRRDPRWRAFAWWSLAAGIAVTLALAARVFSPPAALGATQRVWVGAILVWGFMHAGAGVRTQPAQFAVVSRQ